MNQYPENYRFYLYNKNTLMVLGSSRDACIPGHVLSFSLDGKELSCEKENGDKKTFRVSLPPHWEKGKNLTVTDNFEGKSNTLFTISIAALCNDKQRLFYNIESCWIADGIVHIKGWAVGNDTVDIQLLDKKGGTIDSSITRSYRRDVMYEYDSRPLCESDEYSSENDFDAVRAGFLINFSADAAKSFKIRFTSGMQSATFKSTVSKAGRHTARISIWKRVSTYLHREGLGNTLKRIVRKLTGSDTRIDYPTWYIKHRPSEMELKRQRSEMFTNPVIFSIVVPLYFAKEDYLKEFLDSVLNQTYPHWELCLADGSGKENSLEESVKRLSGGDTRIRYQLFPKNQDIAANTNAAIKMSTGDFIVSVDCNDLLAPNALYECARALLFCKNADVMYTDEDKVDMSGKNHFDPNFKPDFNPDYLCSMNYICHMFLVKRELLERVGLLRKEFDDARDYDFILRCCEQAEEIYHIPGILYHRRCNMNPDASGENESHSVEAGRLALEAHYKRMGLPATVESTDHTGIYRTTYHWEQAPLVSILIPNKDHVEDLKKCLESIEDKSVYRNYEYIIIENNSTEEETFRYYEEIKKRSNVKVVNYQGGFNYSRINNFGEQYAKGEYLLLLNNDTEMIDGNCLQEMLNYCMREDVGLVGAKLLYEDDTIQHAGVIVGLGGVAGHTFVGADRGDAGYQNRILCAQNYSAVTAACLMVKRDLYREVGGLTEEFEVAFNDTDFCLKIRALGKLVVYTPYAELHHHESKSRGYEDTPEKMRRFNGEIERFQKRWAEFLKKGDPCYNPNLTISDSDFSLRF